MSEHAHGRTFAALFDQQSEEHRIADWGGDELFTRMPRPPAVDDAPAPRFRPSLTLLDAPEERRRAIDGTWNGARDRRAGAPEERLGLAVVDAPAVHPAELRPDAARVSRWEPEPVDPGDRWRPELADGWDRSGARPMKVITGRPDAVPRPISTAPAQRRRPARSPAEWIGPRPERIMAWAFALGLLLILVAISTADAAAV